MVAKGTGRWVYFSFSGGSSPPPAAGSFLPYSPSILHSLYPTVPLPYSPSTLQSLYPTVPLPYSPSTIGRKALRFVLLCSRLVKKVLTLALHCSNYCCVAVIIAEWCGSVYTSRHAEQPWNSS